MQRRSSAVLHCAGEQGGRGGLLVGRSGHAEKCGLFLFALSGASHEPATSRLLSFGLLLDPLYLFTGACYGLPFSYCLPGL